MTWKNSGFEQDSNPRPLRFRCNAPPTELSKPVIVKNSSQNILSADCRPNVGRQSADCWPTVGRLLANSWPTVGQQSANSRPTDGISCSWAQCPLHIPVPSCPKHRTSDSRTSTAWFQGKIDCLELNSGLFGCPGPWQRNQLHLGILLIWLFSTLNLQGCYVMTAWKGHGSLAPFRILTCMFCFPLGITLAIIPSCCKRGNYRWVCSEYSNSLAH